VLVYQRYQNLPFLEAVRLARAPQRHGCHFITDAKKHEHSIVSLSEERVLLTSVLSVIQIDLRQCSTGFIVARSFVAPIETRKFLRFSNKPVNVIGKKVFSDCQRLKSSNKFDRVIIKLSTVLLIFIIFLSLFRIYAATGYRLCNKSKSLNRVIKRNEILSTSDIT